MHYSIVHHKSNAEICRQLYKIPLRELKTRKVRIKRVKSHQQTKDLLSTHVVDTRRSKPPAVFYASRDEAKRSELRSWQKLHKNFARRTRGV